MATGSMCHSHHLKVSCLLHLFYRIQLQKWSVIMGQHFALLSWEVTRQLYQLQQVTMSIILCICLMASFITMFAVPTEMA
jgi:hypothetical protein